MLDIVTGETPNLGLAIRELNQYNIADADLTRLSLPRYSRVPTGALDESFRAELDRL